jgi:RNA polymerase sigma-70 factor (ECF subfamily)
VNHLQSARVRRETYVGPWLPEPLVADPANGTPDILRIDESLSMAFLVLLERLTPVERAVFLLREVFEYEYAEVAAALGQSEVNCRQILRRARKHIAAARPRFAAPVQKRDDLLERFMSAAGNGDIDGLVSLLAQDAVLHADGGGKAIATAKIIRGSDRVARTVVNSMRTLVPKDLVPRVASINGQPGLITYQNGKPFSVVSLDIQEGQIRAVYVVTNPEKLSHLPALVERDAE